MRAAVLLGLVLGGVLVAAVLYSIEVWFAIDGGSLSNHGMLALALGVGATLLLGIVLMGLVFYSRRKGFDDEAGRN